MLDRTVTRTTTRNNNQNFVFVKGKTKLQKVTLAASVAVDEGSFIYPNPSNDGTYIAADATAGDLFGIIRQTITATDSDYASTKLVEVEVPCEPHAEVEFTVGTGTFTTADIGKDVDLASAKTVAVDSSSAPVLIITGYISSTRGIAKIMGGGLRGLPATT